MDDEMVCLKPLLQEETQRERGRYGWPIARIPSTRLICVSCLLSSSSCLHSVTALVAPCNCFLLPLPEPTVPLVCLTAFTTDGDPLEDTVEDTANAKPEGRNSCCHVISKDKRLQTSHERDCHAVGAWDSVPVISCGMAATDIQ